MVRKPLVVLLIAAGIIIFFGLAAAQDLPDSLVIAADSTFMVEPLGEDFAPAPGCEPCGWHFLIRTAAPERSDPPSIIMFLNRFKDIRFEYHQEVLFTGLTVNAKMRGLVPQARLNYHSGYVSAEIWVPMDELDRCPRLKALLKVPIR